MIKWISYTGKGRRKQNEDWLVCKPLGDSASLLLIADGMGGYAFGAESAQLVASTIASVLENDPTFCIPEAVRLANEALARFKAQKRIDNTGCTIAGAIVFSDVARVFWAGDSRVYVIRDKHIVYETEDHSLINEMKKVKVLSPEQIEKYEHIVRNAIMGEESDITEVEDVPISEGDEILVCSDGLYRNMPVDLALMKLREKGDSFRLDGRKFDDNHSLIYAVV